MEYYPGFESKPKNKKSKYKSKVKKAFFSENYQVEFSIDHQTFRLQESEPDDPMTSKEHAKWLKKQLDAAFKRLIES